MTQAILPLGFMGTWQWLIIGVIFLLIPYIIYRAAKGLIKERYKHRNSNR